jgi:hypothetical protein
MVEYARRPALKLSPGKETWAGRKQVSFSPRLRRLQAKAVRVIRRRELGES